LEREIDWVDTISLSVRFEKDVIERLEARSSEGRFAESETTAWRRRHLEGTGGVSLESAWHGLSRWSRSSSKRLFDCACAILALPVIMPLLLVIAAMVRLTSPGPILFLQERVGRDGRIFKIFKFRTMAHLADAEHHPITTSTNQQFTSIGPLLRRLKLDELPQIVNVLLGHMSLVGPRPKLPEHVLFNLPCRPGITGLATIMFASEEVILARVPKDRLKEYYHLLVLPMKQQLDADYMACATFLSDLRILVNSVLRRWSGDTLENAVIASTVVSRNGGELLKLSCPEGMRTMNLKTAVT
jgi:lipopolysaccharide/colanic/teichoic acid biosynthesis glycosyltransferase